MKINISILSFFLFNLFAIQSFSQSNKDRVVIDEYLQKIEFFINARGELNTKLSVKLTVSSQTSLSYRYKQVLFFDENSSIQNILKQNYKKRKTKVEPIISDYESDGIFHSDLKVCYFDHVFETAGEQITIQYEKIFTDVKYLDPLYFSSIHPIKNSKIAIKIPNWLNLDIREFNFDKQQPTIEKKKDEDSRYKLYNLKNLEHHTAYSRVPRRNKLNAHLILIPTDYTVAGKTISLMNEVGDLYDWYASLVDQVDNENENLKVLVEELTADQTEDSDKIRAIYYWVQDNIRYIAFENGIMGFKPENCQNVYNNRYGDCKGMANLTKEMLKIAGYDARLTWLGTNDLPYDYTIPSLLVDNHMICTVILEDEKIYLDATEKYADLYNYAHRIRGKEVLIENGEDYLIDKIPASDYEKNKEYHRHEFDLIEDKLVGTGEYSLEGNRKTWLFYRLSNIPEADWSKSLKTFLRNDDKNIQLRINNQPNLKNRDKDPVFEYDISIANQVIDLGTEVYVNPEIEYEFYKYEMEEDRNVAFEFSETFFIEQETILNIPENWSVQYMPEALDIQNDKYSFSLNYKQEAGKIKYLKVFKIKKTLLETSDFPAWNTAIKKITDFYSDQIILNKD